MDRPLPRYLGIITSGGRFSFCGVDWCFKSEGLSVWLKEGSRDALPDVCPTVPGAGADIICRFSMSGGGFRLPDVERTVGGTGSGFTPSDGDVRIFLGDVIVAWDGGDVTNVRRFSLKDGRVAGLSAGTC